MSVLIKNLSSRCLTLAHSSRWSPLLTPLASMYTDEYHKMDGFLHARNQIKTRFGEHAATFLTRMRTYAEPGNSGMIFSDDIKNYIHLIEDQPEDIAALKSMLHKYVSQDSIKFQNFSIGPIIMRAMMHMKKGDLALELLKDEQLKIMFEEMSSFAIVALIMYKEDRFDDLLAVYDSFAQKDERPVPTMVSLPAAAVCYKMNTEKSYEKLSEIVKTTITRGRQPMDRILNFHAALAIKQGRQIEALEILNTRVMNYFIPRNLKIQAFADSGRVRDALDQLADGLRERRDGRGTVPTIFKETIEKLRDAVKKADDPSLTESLSELESKLEAKCDKSLDDDLFTPIQKRKPLVREDGREEFGFHRRQQAQRERSEDPREYRRQAAYGQRDGGYRQPDNYRQGGYRDGGYRDNRDGGYRDNRRDRFGGDGEHRRYNDGGDNY